MPKNSMLRKGQSLADGTYVYRCGCSFANPECTYCYGANLERCRYALKSARGERYYGLLKTILSHIGKDLVDAVRAIRDRNEPVTVLDVAWIAWKHDLNFKATCEWLEETSAIRSGVYNTVHDSRIKISEMMQQAQLLEQCHSIGQHDLLAGQCQRCGKKIKQT
jgi:hypothetical protein